jgi:hypothetical protein
MQNLSVSRLSEPSTWAGVSGIGGLMTILHFIAMNGTDGVAIVAKSIPLIASADWVGLGAMLIGAILAIIKREKGGAVINARPVGKTAQGESLYIVGDDHGA